ncbi:MAG: hypothetical protein ACJ77M_02385 [Thermoleophilaceae bacterium]
MARGAQIPFVAWRDRAREPIPSCLFYGNATLPDVIAARLIAAIAERLPEIVFHVAGPVVDALGPRPANLSAHERPTAELFRTARVGLSPLTEVLGGNDRVVAFARAGLPVIASPAAARGFEPSLTDCWLVATPELRTLRDAIIESIEWDWSEPVAEAHRLVIERYDRLPAPLHSVN